MYDEARHNGQWIGGLLQKARDLGFEVTLNEVTDPTELGVPIIPSLSESMPDERIANLIESLRPDLTTTGILQFTSILSTGDSENNYHELGTLDTDRLVIEGLSPAGIYIAMNVQAVYTVLYNILSTKRHLYPDFPFVSKNAIPNEHPTIDYLDRAIVGTIGAGLNVVHEESGSRATNQYDKEFYAPIDIGDELKCKLEKMIDYNDMMNNVELYLEIVRKHILLESATNLLNVSCIIVIYNALKSKTIDEIGEKGGGKSVFNTALEVSKIFGGKVDFIQAVVSKLLDDDKITK